MKTKFDTKDNVWIRGTIVSAQKYKDEIYYKIKECEELIPEREIFFLNEQGVERRILILEQKIADLEKIIRDRHDDLDGMIQKITDKLTDLPVIYQ